MGAYKGKRAHNQEGSLEEKERKKSYVVLRQTKRESSLKEPSHSTWEDLCCLEVDSVDRVGRASLGSNFGEVWKCRSIGGMCEAEPKSVKSVEMKRQQVCG
jgi:hypothetical protein